MERRIEQEINELEIRITLHTKLVREQQIEEESITEINYLERKEDEERN